jgi:hypothetical protein
MQTIMAPKVANILIVIESHQKLSQNFGRVSEVFFTVYGRNNRTLNSTTPNLAPTILCNQPSPPPLSVGPSVATHAEAFARLIAAYNWTRFGVLLDIEQYHPSLVPALDQLLPFAWLKLPRVDMGTLSALSSVASISPEIQALSSNFFTSNATVNVLRLYARSLRAQNVRVLLLFCGADSLPRVLEALEVRVGFWRGSG